MVAGNFHGLAAIIGYNNDVAVPAEEFQDFFVTAEGINDFVETSVEKNHVNYI